MADIPYVGAGVLASAVGIDKAFMKQLFGAKGLPQVLYMVVLERTWKADASGVRTEAGKRLGLPVFVKPAHLGSSVGISKVTSTEVNTLISSSARNGKVNVIPQKHSHFEFGYFMKFGRK